MRPRAPKGCKTSLLSRSKNENKSTRWLGSSWFFPFKYFLRSRIAVFSPLDDLRFISSMIQYRQKDSEIVLISMKLHLWYITEKLVVLSIYNEELSSFTKSLLAKKLFAIPRPTQFQTGKPKFPTIKEHDLPLLSNLLGPSSCLLFTFFPGNHDWLAPNKKLGNDVRISTHEGFLF